MSDDFNEVFGIGSGSGVSKKQLVAATLEEVEEKAAENLSASEVAFRERVSRYPFEYIIANAIGEGNPKEVMNHLHLYGTSDKAKEMLGRFLATLPSGLDLGHADKQIEYFLAAEPSLRANASDLLSRAVIYVNRYNAQDLLTQFVAWVPTTPTVLELVSHKIPVRSSGGNFYIDYSDSTTLFQSVAELLIAHEAGKKKFKYICDEDLPIYHAMVYFLMLAYRVQAENGKYTISKNYHGDRDVPLDWIHLAEQVAVRLNKRTPAGSLIFQQDVRASLYTDIRKIMENDPTVKGIEKVKSTYAKYVTYCANAFATVEYTRESLDAAVAKATAVGFPSTIFDKKVKAENDLHEVRSANMENFELIYGEKNLGFDYPHVPSHAFGALTVLYQSMRALCMMKGRNFRTEWTKCLNEKVSIVLCGQDVANRATILESVCQAIGWTLIVSNQRPVKLGSYAQRMAFDKEWGGVAQAQEKAGAYVVVYWIGMKDVEILDNIPSPPEGTEEDKAIMQTLFNYSKMPVTKTIALVVHHDVMKTPKFVFEMKQLKGKGLNLAMVPHPASDATGISWIALPLGVPVETEGTPQFVWSHKLIESTCAKQEVLVAIGAGSQRQPPSLYLNASLAKFLITAIQWQRVKLRQAGSRVYSDQTEKDFKEIFSVANPAPELEMEVEKSPATKRPTRSKDWDELEKITYYLRNKYDKWDWRSFCGNLENLEITLRSISVDRARDLYRAVEGGNEEVIQNVVAHACRELALVVAKD